MLCNVTGVMTLPDGQDATGVLFTMIPSVGGVVSIGADTVAQAVTKFRVGQGGAVDFTAQSGEYVIRSSCGRVNDTVVYIPETASVDVNDIIPERIPHGSKDTYYTKRGDTITFGCVYLDHNGIVHPLTGMGVRATMRHTVTASEYDFVVTVVDEAGGRFDLTITTGVSATLDIGSYDFDIRFSDGVNVRHTHTGHIIVEEAVT